MTTPPQLSPDLRPIRYCPNCGQRVAQKADDCFMCGHNLRASQPRRLSLPVRDLIMVLVVLGVAYLWWTRGGQSEEAAAQLPVATATTTATSTAVALSTTPPPPAAQPVPDIELTLPVTAGISLTVTASITATTPLTPTATPTPIVYTVVSGDNVNKIAARYGISARDLMAANDMSSDLLQVDQKLIIPTVGSAGEEVVAAAPTPTPVVYTVKRGDTVNLIAARYGISVRDLMAFNGMSSDLIQIGQKLTIPLGDVPRGADGLPVPTPTPTPKSAIYLVVVRAGDTIESIAKRLGSSVEAIVDFNDNLQNADTIIRPGEQVIVPVGTITATLTLQSVTGPTATPVPLPTATPGPPHAAPQLLTPLDGAQVDGDSVLLQWLSVGTLGPTEVYVVRVSPTGRTRDDFTATTIGTSYRIPNDWLARQGQRTSRFQWNVQVARSVRTQAGETSSLLATSPPSRVRSFQWSPPSP